MSHVLTNNTGSSIILTLNNVTSPEANVISMAPGESLLYDEVIITNQLDPNYNVPLIYEYIDAGILLNQEIQGVTESELQLMSQGNTVVDLITGIPKLLSKVVTEGIDNLQVLPVSNPTGALQYIYYKSIQGMSISMDFGKSQTLISNVNLLYPNEITSFAVQVYESNNGVLQPVNRLYIGTLREGVKTFTPGVDTTYVNFDENASFNEISPIFKNSLEEVIQNVTTGPIYTPVSDIKTFPTFCPTFVLAIINTPYNSGCPIFIASRSIQTLVTTDVDYTIDPDNPTTGSYSQINTQRKIFFKYLHSNIYQYSNIYQNNVNIQTPFFDDGGSPPLPLYNKWILLQETNNWGFVPLIHDISGIITEVGGNDYNDNLYGENTEDQFFASDIVDVITEYIPTGALVLLKYPGPNGGEGSYPLSNSLYKITCFESLVDPITKLPNRPIISTIALPNTGAFSYGNQWDVRNMSYLFEIGSSKFNIFLTEPNNVWRYSSVSNIGIANTEATVIWEQLLYNGNIVSYFDTAVTNGILTVGGTTSLKELAGFVVLPKNNTINNYIALLASEIGLIFYSLKLINNIFEPGAKTTRTLLTNIAKFPISDIKTSISGESLYAFTSSYASQIPRTYYENTNCLQLVDNQLSLMKDVYYLKPNIENSDSPYYVTENFLRVNYVPSMEQLSHDPVLINANYSYNLKSAEYNFKLSKLSDDHILVDCLLSSLAYKYYIPYITERIISSVSPAEPDILELHDYKHAFKANIVFISFDTDLSSYTQISVSKQQIVTLPGTYIFDYFFGDYTSFVCIGLDNSVIIPSNISTVKNTSGEFVSYLTFTSAFSGTIYMHTNTVGPVPFAVSGLFAVLDYSNGGLYPSLTGYYPQVSLDSSVLGLLNDIRYIDANRLEISFTSAVNTIVNLI